MTSSDTRRYEMFVRVRDFGETYASLFPAASLAQEQFAAVGAAVKALAGHAVTKMSVARVGKSPKAAARLALIERLETLALTGRAMAQNKPELADRFRVPHPQPDQALITAGRLFAQDAEALKAEFLAHAMPETFIADLTKAVGDFEAAIQDRQNGKAASAGVRASIKTAITAGMAAVTRLDAIVTNHLGRNPQTMAVWRRERRVAATRRRTAAAANNATAGSPSAPTVMAAAPASSTSPVTPATGSVDSKAA